MGRDPATVNDLQSASLPQPPGGMGVTTARLSTRLAVINLITRQRNRAKRRRASHRSGRPVRHHDVQIARLVPERGSRPAGATRQPAEAQALTGCDGGH